MSFVFSKKHEFNWPVIIEVPTDDGTHDRAEFRARFKVLSDSEVAKLSTDDVVRNSDFEMMEKALIGWEDVTGPDGKKLGFNKANVAAFLDVPYIRTAIVRAYLTAMYGDNFLVKN